MPLTIALVGIIGTLLITGQQQRNAETHSMTMLASAERLADADRQVKILELFADKITSPDVAQRILALRLLRVIDGELAQELASAVSETEPQHSSVKKVADEVAHAAATRARELPKIYIHIRTEADRARARLVGDTLESRGFQVIGIELLTGIGPDVSQLRYFGEAEVGMAGQLAAALRLCGVTVQLIRIPGYKDASIGRPRHFELWFAADEPPTPIHRAGE